MFQNPFRPSVPPSFFPSLFLSLTHFSPFYLTLLGVGVVNPFDHSIWSHQTSVMDVSFPFPPLPSPLHSRVIYPNCTVPCLKLWTNHYSQNKFQVPYIHVDDYSDTQKERKKNKATQHSTSPETTFSKEKAALRWDWNLKPHAYWQLYTYMYMYMCYIHCAHTYIYMDMYTITHVQCTFSSTCTCGVHM